MAYLTPSTILLPTTDMFGLNGMTTGAPTSPIRLYSAPDAGGKFTSTASTSGAYQFASGFFAPSRFAFKTHWPAPDSEVAHISHHTHAYPGLKWEVPICFKDGAFPWWIGSASIPPGATIKKFLTPSTGNKYLVDETTYVLTWDNPVAGTYSISIPGFDQAGASVTIAWTLTVATGNHYFAQDTATGDGSGSSPSNYALMSTVYGANDAATSPAQGKILQLGDVNFTLNAPWHMNWATKVNTINVSAGKTAIFTAGSTSARIIRDVSDSWISGVKFIGFGGDASGDGTSSTISCQEAVNNMGTWRCIFQDSYATGTGSNNNSVQYYNNTGGTKRKRIFSGQNQYINCVDICAIDCFGSEVVIFSDTETTSGTTRTQPVLLIKGNNSFDIIDFKSINPACRNTGNGTVNLNNNNSGGQSSGTFRYSKVIGLVSGWSPEIAILWNNYAFCTATQCYDDRNTAVGVVSAKNFVGAMATFTGLAVETPKGTIGDYDGNSTGGITITNSDSIATSGILDGSYEVISTSRRGKDGASLYSS